ncbi:MAG: ethanolamine permease [Spirosomaceae bacterium]|nr:ethanolamine permease [Spirosomataceae bacterium]
MATTPHLQRALTPLLLWGLGVGYVISGMYFGWNLGLEKGGTLGMAIATLLVIVLYVSFTLCYAELACAIPKAGGVFDYATRALGRDWGFLAGLAQVFEFVLAPPAIAAGIGAHLHLFFPQLSPLYGALGAYLLFTLLNVLGVKLAATFELVITLLAIVGIGLFVILTYPHIQTVRFTQNALPHGWAGVWAAIPFAIWFFLGIEGLANAAEESTHPQRDLTRGFAWAMLTLVLLCGLTFVGAVGVAGWTAAVFKTDGSATDSPLPLVLSHFLGENGFYWAVVVFGLFGLVASFHGLLMAAGRATFEMGRVRLLPAWLGKIQERFKTPSNALFFNMLVGITALLSNTTADIIVLSVLGALTLYGFGVVSLLALRRRAPTLVRPFKTPLYPYLPVVSLVLIGIAFGAVVVSNFTLSLYYLGALGGAFLLHKVSKK